MIARVVAALLFALPGVTPALHAQSGVELRALGAMVEHRLAFDSGRDLPERATGIAFGIGAASTLRGVELEGHIYGGPLSGVDAQDEDRGMGELALRGGVPAFPWLMLQVGTTVRAYSTPLFTQRWMMVSAGGEARLSMLDGSVQGRLRAALAPIVTVTDMDGPDLAVQLASGLSWHRGALSAGVEYSVERHDFRSGAERRYEQLSTLRANVALRVLR